MDPSKMKIVYVISQSGDRSFWTRVGVAFVNRDGSLNVKLNCVPITGEMHIRDYEPQGRTTRDAPPNTSDSPKHYPTGDEDFPF